MHIEISFPIESSHNADIETTAQKSKERVAIEILIRKHFPRAYRRATPIGQYTTAYAIVIPNPENHGEFQEMVSTPVPHPDILQVLDILPTVDSKFVYLLSSILQPNPVA